MNKKLKLIEIIGVIFLALIVSVLFVRADWTPPTTSPTTCPSGQPGCDAPINTSSSSQNKLGSLGVSGLLADMIKVGSSGITFSDGSVQTTAAVSAGSPGAWLEYKFVPNGTQIDCAWISNVNGINTHAYGRVNNNKIELRFTTQQYNSSWQGLDTGWVNTSIIANERYGIYTWQVSSGIIVPSGAGSGSASIAMKANRNGVTFTMCSVNWP